MEASSDPNSDNRVGGPQHVDRRSLCSLETRFPHRVRRQIKAAACTLTFQRRSSRRKVPRNKSIARAFKAFQAEVNVQAQRRRCVECHWIIQSRDEMSPYSLELKIKARPKRPLLSRCNSQKRAQRVTVVRARRTNNSDAESDCQTTEWSVTGGCCQVAGAVWIRPVRNWPVCEEDKLPDVC
jgi:hypothetical protein